MVHIYVSNDIGIFYPCNESNKSILNRIYLDKTGIVEVINKTYSEE